MSDFASLVREGRTLPFHGWDFGPMQGRWERAEPPWDLRELVRGRFRSVTHFVDLGTGGGEFLSSLAPLPTFTTATEGYEPNLPIARARLEPMGVRVVSSSTDRELGVPANSADLVLARHESFDPREVWRVLRHGGTFITQQVGGRNYLDLHRRFGTDPETPFNQVDRLDHLTEEILGAGFRLETSGEAVFPERFRDVGAVVYYLRAAPWEVPGFSVERFREVLASLHEEIQRVGFWELMAHRLLVVADKT